MVNYKKWIGLIILDVFLFVPVFPDLIFLYLTWRLWLLYLEMFLAIVYLIFRLLAFFLIQLPLLILGKTGSAVTEFFRTGLRFFYARPKTAAVLSIIPLFIMLNMFPLSLSNPLQPEVWIANSWNIVKILFGTFLVTFTIARAVAGLMDVSLSGKSAGAPGLWRGETRGERVENFAADASWGAQQYKEMKETADKMNRGADPDTSSKGVGAKGYRQLRKKGIAGDSGKIVNDIAEVAVRYGRKIPIVGEAFPEEAAMMEAGSLTAMGYGLGALWLFIVIFVLLAFAFVVVMTLLLGLLISSLFGPWLDLIGSSLLAGLGLGAEYGNWFGTEFANQFLVDVGVDVSPVVDTYLQARARVFCLLQGPSCLRAQMINNTRRPGSQEVGQSYGLKVDRFTVGNDQINIRDSAPDEVVPVSFTLSNPRRGLKGINAYNVEYRIQIIDAQKGTANPYCDTGWLNVSSGFNIDGGPGGSDNDIYPGTSASTGFLRIDKSHVGEVSDASNPGDRALTLANCEMLQPGAGTTRTAKLYLKYEYFSQATLFFQAMSLENLRANPDVEKELKESETADTPVKAAINVNSPVTFRTERQGTSTADVFATLNTDENDVRYSVDSMKIRGSRYLERPSGAGDDCSFAQDFDNDLIYDLTGTAKERLIQSDSHDRLFGTGEAKGWYDRNFQAPLIGCIFEVNQDAKDELSETGETLTMGVAANYTVAKEDQVGNMRVLNRICGTVRCPILVSMSDDSGISDYDFKNECTGIDSGNGCTAVNLGSLSGWNSIYEGRGVKAANSGADTVLDSGTVAVKLDGIPDGGYSFEESAAGERDNPVGGISKDNWQKIDPDLDGTVESEEENSLNFTVIQYKYNDVRGGDWEVEFRELRDGQCGKGDIVAPAGTDEFKVLSFNKPKWGCKKKKSNSGGGNQNFLSP